MYNNNEFVGDEFDNDKFDNSKFDNNKVIMSNIAYTTLGSVGQSAEDIGAPEVALGKAALPYASKAVDKYGGTVLFMPLLVFSIILILIGITVFSVDKNKVPGVMLILFAAALGGGVFYMMHKTSTATTSKAD